MQTYEMILSRMKKAYYDACGEMPSKNNDAMLRLQAVASELYNISCFGDFALKQTNVKTASGEYLDVHAHACGLTRKSPTKATGKVTFSVSEPAIESITIPTGVICSLEDSPFIQFVTTTSATIQEGFLNAQADIEALDFGEEYNVPEGTITVMVNPPAMVEAVINEKAIKGGSNTESDETLRRRIEDSYDFVNNAISLAYYAERVCDFDEVKDCKITKNATASAVNVYCRTASGSIRGDLVAKIKSLLGVIELFDADLYFISAVEKPVNFTVILHGGSDENVAPTLQKYIDTLRIGECVVERECERMLCDACDANSCEVYADSIGVDVKEYVTLGDVEVHIYD